MKWPNLGHPIYHDILATQSGRNAEIYKLINYWLNYDNSLLKIITRLTEVRYDDKGERFLGNVLTSCATKNSLVVRMALMNIPKIHLMLGQFVKTGSSNKL